MSKYSEKLKDPRWQKKRLKIMERDDFQCQSCGDLRSPLNVHHIEYIKGRDPWGYPDFLLITWCDQCHEDEHKYRDDSENDLIIAFKAHGFSAPNIENLTRSLMEAKARKIPVSPGLLTCIFCAILEGDTLEESLRVYFKKFNNRSLGEDAKKQDDKTGILDL